MGWPSSGALRAYEPTELRVLPVILRGKRYKFMTPQEVRPVVGVKVLSGVIMRGIQWRVEVIIVALIGLLFLSGVPNISGAGFSGGILHVWDHDMKSSEYVYRTIQGMPLRSIQLDLLATNYTGSQYVNLLSIYDSFGDGWGFYWRGNNQVYVVSDDSIVAVYPLNTGNPHTYRIEVKYDPFLGTPDEVDYYIDGRVVYNETWDIPWAVSRVIIGGYLGGAKTFDLYLDNVFYNGQLAEDFDDGKDNFFQEVTVGNGDSGAEVVNSEQVPEFPVLQYVQVAVGKVIG